MKKQKGAVAVMVGLLMPVLLGFMALALDGSYIMLNRHRMQVAADSAALVAAGAIQNSLPANAHAMALTATAANGFTHAQDGTVVTVAIPPGLPGLFAADTDYARVTVTQPMNVFMAWVLGVLQMSTTASAVGGPAGTALPCVLSLASASSGALSVGGGSSVTANACGIYVNSTSNSALQVANNGTLIGHPIEVVGHYRGPANPNVVEGATLTADPFGSWVMPAFGGCTYTNFKATGNGPLVLLPGTYCGGISLSGTHTVHLNDGLYVIYGGGIKITGTSSPIEGNNITIYNTGNVSTHPYGEMKLTGGVVLDLSAPTTGAYAGMLFMQDKLNTQSASIAGNAGSLLEGNFYFPKSTLNLSGSSGTHIPMGVIVALTVNTSGNSRFSLTNTYGGMGGTRRSALYQ